MAEWLKAPVLKTGNTERYSGVRIPLLPFFPFRTQINYDNIFCSGMSPKMEEQVFSIWRDDRVAEGARLLIECTP